MNSPLCGIRGQCLFGLIFLSLSSARLSAFESDPPRSLRQLAKDLDDPDFTKAAAARAKLIRIVKSREAHAEEADAILNEFSKRAVEWLISVGNERDEVEDQKMPVLGLRAHVREETPAADFRYLTYNRSLPILRMSGKHITDDHLAVLSGLPELELLDAWKTQITGKNLDRLVLPALASLHIADSPLTDEGICKLVSPTLRALDVSGTQVTNQMLLKLALTDLTELNVQRTRIDAEGLKAVVRFPKLEWLRFDAVGLSPEVVKVLSESKALREIKVRCDQEAQRMRVEALLQDLPKTVRRKIEVHSAVTE